MDQIQKGRIAMLQEGTVSQTRIPATILAAATQSYELSFDHSNGFFTLAGTDGTIPSFLQIIVTEPDTSVTITCTGGLTFEESPVTLMPFNTLKDLDFHLDNNSTLTITCPTKPQEWDRIGFSLNTRFTSASNQTIQSLRPELYITAENLGPKTSLDLTYKSTDGSFSIQDSLLDLIVDAEVIFRLGTGPDKNQGSEFVLHLVTKGTTQAAIFASSPVVSTKNGILNPFPPNMVTPLTPDSIKLNIPFNSNAGVGMNFVIEYEGVKIFSPDPIIIDKTIGINPGPGF
jgi:hypothetical protein